MKYVYLAGAIASTDDPSTWRKRAAQLLGPDFGVFDPLEQELAVVTDEAIVRLDYKLILDSVAVLAFVGEHSWGTAMELAFAKQNGVPVYAFDDGVYTIGNERMSRWLRYHCTSIDTEMMSAICRVG